MSWFKKLDDAVKKGAGGILDTIDGGKTATKSMDMSIAAAESSFSRLPAKVEAPMQRIRQYGVRNAVELRQMKTSDLLELLKNSADVLEEFENHLFELYDIAAAQSDHVDTAAKRSYGMFSAITPLSSSMATKRAAEQTSHVMPQVNALCDQALGYLSALLPDLSFIPEKYRLSGYLKAMSGYLEDGEEVSWEGCIKTFKQDSQNQKVLEHFSDFGNKLDLIEQHTSSTAKSAGLMAFFAGVTAVNTW